MDGVSPNINKKSPKTPGGISKSLLTPCRRVGLSRKWKKSGCSPFISPLSAQNVTPERTEGSEEKKRKKCNENEHMEINSKITKEHLNSFHESSISSPNSCDNSNKNNDITSTPCRNNQIPRKKSKILSLSLKNSQDKEKEQLDSQIHLQNNSNEEGVSKTNKNNVTENKSVFAESYKQLKNSEVVEDKVKPIKVTPGESVSKLVRTESRTKKLSLKKSHSKNECKPKELKPKDMLSNPTPTDKSPNNLTKECIVVIQNSILKTAPQLSNKDTNIALENSDSEPDVPLSSFKRANVEEVTLNTLDDDDFISKPIKKKIRNLSTNKSNRTTSKAIDSSSTSQSSQEDMDKKTIIVKKTYVKAVNLHKAKSTGSITQKDIDDLKARIEMKKKLLLAKTMSLDTEELRVLIKKWQKGCQEALIELLDLMKKKLPDRQNMDYSEMLGNLNIPAELVGYDSENDCFITPNDTNVLLSAFKL